MILKKKITCKLSLMRSHTTGGLTLNVQSYELVGISIYEAPINAKCCILLTFCAVTRCSICVCSCIEVWAIVRLLKVKNSKKINKI